MLHVSHHAGVHFLQLMFLVPVVVLWLQDHLIQNLRLHVGLVVQQRLRLPDQMVGLETERRRRRKG